MLELFIDNRSDRPIYEQIYLQIKSEIVCGKLKSDEPLPSIRNLAKDLRISVITTKRAYEELERDGLIYTVTGKGCFVAVRSPEMLKEENLKKIEEHLREIIMLSSSCGISREDIIKMFEALMEE